MKTLLLCLMLTGCATAPDIKAKCEAGGGCMTIHQAIQAMRKAWDNGWAKGHDHGVDTAPPTCRREI